MPAAIWANALSAAETEYPTRRAIGLIWRRVPLAGDYYTDGRVIPGMRAGVFRATVLAEMFIDLDAEPSAEVAPGYGALASQLWERTSDSRHGIMRRAMLLDEELELADYGSRPITGDVVDPCTFLEMN